MSGPFSLRCLMHVPHDYGFSAPSLKTAKASEMQIARVWILLYWCSWKEVVVCKAIIREEYLILREIKLK